MSRKIKLLGAGRCSDPSTVTSKHSSSKRRNSTLLPKRHGGASCDADHCDSLSSETTTGNVSSLFCSTSLHEKSNHSNTSRSTIDTATSSIASSIQQSLPPGQKIVTKKKGAIVPQQISAACRRMTSTSTRTTSDTRKDPEKNNNDATSSATKSSSESATDRGGGGCCLAPISFRKKKKQQPLPSPPLPPLPILSGKSPTVAIRKKHPGVVNSAADPSGNEKYVATPSRHHKAAEEQQEGYLPPSTVVTAGGEDSIYYRPVKIPPQGSTTTTAPPSSGDRRNTDDSSFRNNGSMHCCVDAPGNTTPPPDPPESISKKKKSKKQVHFTELARYRIVDPLDELTDKAENLWYQENEFRMMHENIHRIAAKVRAEDPRKKNKARRWSRKQNKICTRGLERIIYCEKSHTARQQALDCVMDFQMLDEATSASNKEQEEEAPEMPIQYKQVTRRCLLEALARAESDELEVRAYYRQNLNQCNMM